MYIYTFFSSFFSFFFIKFFLGKNLFQISTHEIGHSLGLLHSTNRSAVMYAFYEGYVPVSEFSLHDDDIAAITAIYGEKRE